MQVLEGRRKRYSVRNLRASIFAAITHLRAQSDIIPVFEAYLVLAVVQTACCQLQRGLIAIVQGLDLENEWQFS